VSVELTKVTWDDPDALSLLAAARAEIDARQAYEGTKSAPDANRMKSDVDVLVAYADGQPAGIGALRAFGQGIGEIKRMYVVPEQRRSGIARQLLEGLESRAREHGFDVIRLDTHDRLPEANRLYNSAGYREIEDYNSNPRANRWYEKPLA
jgi:ribosomal protein S18 acetylase RimI-like enzyme